MIETKAFDPERVVGGYAKTKAEATRFCLRQRRPWPSGHRCPSVRHPRALRYRAQSSCGIDPRLSYRKAARLRPGGYDFVDVRDVAAGCLAAVTRGTVGECYILSNEHYEVKNMLDSVKKITGVKKVRMIPMWIAHASAPLLRINARIHHKKPLYTSYSLYTLTSNGRFSHAKATKELGYQPRSFAITLKDTLRWLKLSKTAKHTS